MDEIAIDTPKYEKVRVALGIQLSDYQIVIDRSGVPVDVPHSDVLREVANQLDQQAGKPVPTIIKPYGN